jgi:hypothetical protein
VVVLTVVSQDISQAISGAGQDFQRHLAAVAEMSSSSRAGDLCIGGWRHRAWARSYTWWGT